LKLYLEPEVEPYFHADSYAYRPGKSAVEAVGVARQRCWKYDWVVDLDIKGFFDNLNHELVMRVVRKHTDCKWILLYIERWLKAPAQFARRYSCKSG
jgi:RNA-directed DNA polymerase